MLDGNLTTFSLQHDLIALGAKLKEIGDVMLVVIDPITSYLGRIDSHRTTDVRNALGPLAKFAEDHNVAVLAITHPPKASQTKAIHAFTGSLAFVADARLVFIAIEEPQTERRLLLAVKNNLGAKAPGLGFRLAQTIVSRNIVASYVVWDPAPVTMSADEAIQATNIGGRAAMTKATDFLREELADGPKPAREIKKAAQDAGLAWATVRRAQERLGIKPRKAGLDQGWTWELPKMLTPPEDAQDDQMFIEDAQKKELSTFGRNGEHLRVPEPPLFSLFALQRPRALYSQFVARSSYADEPRAFFGACCAHVAPVVGREPLGKARPSPNQRLGTPRARAPLQRVLRRRPTMIGQHGHERAARLTALFRSRGAS